MTEAYADLADANMSEENSGERTRWVTFALLDETYAVDVLKVQEVQRMSEIAPVPGAPTFVMGIINLRGNVVTVIDGARRLGLKPRPINEYSRIIILEVGNRPVGVKIDRLYEVVDVPVKTIHAAPRVGDARDKEYVAGVAHIKDKLVILLDEEKLAADEGWLQSLEQA